MAETAHHGDEVMRAASRAQTVADIGALLRLLRRRYARQQSESVPTYRELATRTGWSLASIGSYLSGRSLPPTDRFDALVRVLGVTAVEAGTLATARDRVEESQRGQPGPPVPILALRQLPADIPQFTGRSTAIAALDALLATRQSTGTTTVALTGTAGVGKTALAVHWSHRVLDQFPDGQLYINLRGFSHRGPAMPAAEAVRIFLDALGVPVPGLPRTLEAQIALYRSLVANRRMLIVLDNATAAEQVRPLLPGAARSMVLVTSRDQLSGLVAEGVHPLTVCPLPPAEAHEFLSRRLGAARAAAESDSLAEIIDRCAGLPLALAVVAARVRSRPGFLLAAVAADLHDDRSRLDTLAGTDPATNVRTAFSWSYERLSPRAARIFRLLGLHPGPDVGMAALASLAGLPQRDLPTVLIELTEAHLVEENRSGRLAVHDLLRAYAAERAHQVDSRAQRLRAIGRLLDHYLHTAYTARQAWYPSYDPIELDPPRPGVRPEVIDGDAAIAWFTTERSILLAAVDLAESTGHLTHVWQLAWTTAHYFDRQMHWDDWVVTQRAGLRAAERRGDEVGQANALRYLGDALGFLGRHEQALPHLHRALGIFRQLRNGIGQALTHHSLSLFAARQGDHQQALAHKYGALALFRRAGNRRGEAGELNGIGWLLAQRGQYEQARILCERAIDLSQQISDRHLMADTWDSLGYIHHNLGRLSQALACYTNALGEFRTLGDRPGEADGLEHIGDIHHANRNDIAAARHWAQALRIVEAYDRWRARHLLDKLAALDGAR